MSMYEYAKKEIAIAKALESRGQDVYGDIFDYGGACYDSALKAFKSLAEDGHSGFSIGLTKHILNRLIDGKPLTPIVERDDIWMKVSFDQHDNYTTYQCKRMSSLFKDVYDNGFVTYKDISSFHCVDINTRVTYHSTLAQIIVNEMYPITLPYMPPDSPVQVYCEDFLTDVKNGDFDTVGLLYLINSEGDKIILNKYFKEEDNMWIEIDSTEYTERIHLSESIEIPQSIDWIPKKED